MVDVDRLDRNLRRWLEVCDRLGLANRPHLKTHQSVELARILAERLLGEALNLAPERIVTLAREALNQARGARRVTIVAHPDDVAVLEQSLGELGALAELTRVVSDPRRARHSLRLETDIGTLDADLAPQLERLARKLRETLRHGT